MAEYVFNVLFSHPVHSPPSKSSKAAIARALQVYQLVNTNRKKSIYIKAGGPLFGSQTRNLIGKYCSDVICSKVHYLSLLFSQRV